MIRRSTRNGAGSASRRSKTPARSSRSRMPTIDEEILAHATAFLDRSVKDEKPFFVWFNSTRMHVWTHLKKASDGRTGIGLTADGMVEHDDMVGELLKKLDDLKIADNTIVIYGTDNGAEVVSWPDGGTTPFHGEKGTTWEGGLRVPCLVRWPGVIKPGTIINEIMSQEDWMPTFLAARRRARYRRQAQAGPRRRGQDFKIHADGYNFLPFFKGEVKKSPRDTIYYFGQGGELNAIRWNDWKVNFAVLAGNIVNGVRSVPGWPSIVHLACGPVRTGRARLSNVHAMVCRPDVAVHSRAAENQGILADDPQLPVPGGEQLERGGDQLSDAQGRGRLEALARAGDDFGTGELTPPWPILHSSAPPSGAGEAFSVWRRSGDCREWDFTLDVQSCHLKPPIRHQGTIHSCAVATRSNLPGDWASSRQRRPGG